MAIPDPEPGLVVSYSYLWSAEHAQGREEGVKDRPCVIVLSVRKAEGRTIVTVVPVSHSMPKRLEDAVEIPPATKRRLGLDEDRSWVVVSEVNRFVWPGPDLRPIARHRFDFGPLPPNLFRQVRNRIATVAAEQRLAVIPRAE